MVTIQDEKSGCHSWIGGVGYALPDCSSSFEFNGNFLIWNVESPALLLNTVTNTEI